MNSVWTRSRLRAGRRRSARQGVRYVPLEALDVRDPDTLRRSARDGESMGEVMFRGNVVMKAI